MFPDPPANVPASEQRPLPAPVLAVLHSHRKDLTPPLAAGSSGAGGIMP
ncbi:hypothetical protein [Paenibacillus cellulositrophicus]